MLKILKDWITPASLRIGTSPLESMSVATGLNYLTNLGLKSLAARKTLMDRETIRSFAEVSVYYSKAGMRHSLTPYLVPPLTLTIVHKKQFLYDTIKIGKIVKTNVCFQLFKLLKCYKHQGAISLKCIRCLHKLLQLHNCCQLNSQLYLVLS